MGVIKQGSDAWNEWRKNNPDYKPDLSDATLCSESLSGVNFNETNLSRVNLIGADLRKAKFISANLYNTNLNEANLIMANLSLSILSETILNKANLINCRIYGIFARNIRLNGAEQAGLIITQREKFAVTVDNFEVAHFIGLLLNNEKILQLIDNITLRMVLILGSFTHQRKAISNVIREKLLNYGFLPVLIDFDQDSGQKNFIKTICTLGNMSQFIIADFTDVKALLGEVSQFLGNITVPIKPLLLKGLEQEYSKLSELQKNSKLFLKIHLYKKTDDLSASFKDKIIDSIEIKNRLRLFH